MTLARLFFALPAGALLIAAAPAPHPAAQAHYAAPSAKPRKVAVAKPRPRPPLARVQAANRAATREPTGMAYLGASQVYAWSEGALYRLYAAPEQVSDIALQPGEALISVAAGDTARWVIGDTSSGSGAGRRVHVLVKPAAVGLKTNLMIATDRRMYHVQLHSTGGVAMPSVSWTYPQDELLALRMGSAAAAAAMPVAPAVAVERLNFNYRITGDRPPWRPVRVFDDGRQTFIEMPDLAGTEAPPLFVSGPRGTVALVNYRLRERYYVVDRIFNQAELRLGERRQQVVRITRARGGRNGR